MCAPYGVNRLSGSSSPDGKQIPHGSDSKGHSPDHIQKPPACQDHGGFLLRNVRRGTRVDEWITENWFAIVTVALATIGLSVRIISLKTDRSVRSLAHMASIESSVLSLTSHDNYNRPTITIAVANMGPEIALDVQSSPNRPSKDRPILMDGGPGPVRRRSPNASERTRPYTSESRLLQNDLTRWRSNGATVRVSTPSTLNPQGALPTPRTKQDPLYRRPHTELENPPKTRLITAETARPLGGSLDAEHAIGCLYGHEPSASTGALPPPSRSLQPT